MSIRYFNIRSTTVQGVSFLSCVFIQNENLLISSFSTIGIPPILLLILFIYLLFSDYQSLNTPPNLKIHRCFWFSRKLENSREGTRRWSTSTFSNPSTIPWTLLRVTPFTYLLPIKDEVVSTVDDSRRRYVSFFVDGGSILVFKKVTVSGGGW